jgi:O-antigen/teichoic acid export membrane protein
VNAAVSLVLGSMGYAGGLVMGFVAGVILSGVFSMGLAMRGGLAVRIRHPLRRYVAMARTFRDFPLYGSIPATAMLVAGQIPLLVISQHHAISHAGYYVVVRSILYSGTLMIASACAQIILKHLAQVRHTHGSVWPYFIRMLALLAAAGLALGASFYLISPLFFRMFLGDAWATSASIARLMSLAMPFWLLGVGIAAAPIAMKILKPGAAWQLTYGAAACLQFAWHALPFMELVARIILFEVVAYAAYVAISVVTMYRHGRAWRESTQAKALQP